MHLLVAHFGQGRKAARVACTPIISAHRPFFFFEKTQQLSGTMGYIASIKAYVGTQSITFV
jgi:hypothetical protein